MQQIIRRVASRFLNPDSEIAQQIVREATRQIIGVLEDASPRERARAAEAARREAMYADYVRLGIGRNAATIIARRYAHHRGELHTLAQWLREQRRRHLQAPPNC